MSNVRLASIVAVFVLLTGCPSASVEPSPPAPAIQAVASDWCGGHDLPESKCTVCNPELTEGFKAAGDWCEEHGYPESACPTCNPVAPPGESDSSFTPGTRIRFKSEQTEARAGIVTAPAALQGLGVGVEVTAQLAFDADRIAEIRSSTGGVVRELKADLGDRVSAGSPLVVLESAAVGDLRAQLASARERSRTAETDLARQQDLRAEGIASPRREELAAQELEAARSRVRSTEAALRAAGASGDGASGRHTVVSPIAGTLVRRPVVLGSAVSGVDLLAMVVDTTRVWALLDVQEEDVGAVRLGQPVSLEVDGIADRTFGGTVTWIAAEVDRRTRTVMARAELDNADGLLRAHQFGRAVIEVQPAAQLVTVPQGAIQRLDDGSVLFVRTGQGVYEPRAVDVGRAAVGRVEIRGPVEPGDQVVTTGAFLLKTELRKDAIGAGCCEVEAPRE
jgi:cobalt-zinc-cadmium efflux system membrane fusion protein